MITIGTADCAKQSDGSNREIKKPTKEQIRVWLADRQARPTPLPSLEQIRLELGWELPSCSQS